MTASTHRESWREQIERYGWYDTLLGKVLNRLKPHLVVMWVSYSRFADRQQPPSRIASETRMLSDEEVLRLPAAFPDQITKPFVEAATSRGDKCIGTFVDNQLIAMSWRSYSTAPHQDGLWVKFEKPYRYGYKSYVLPAYRGLRAQRGGTTDEYCLSQGCDRSISFIERHNLPSMKSKRRRSDFHALGYVFIVRLFGRRFILSTPTVKTSGFAFYESDSKS